MLIVEEGTKRDVRVVLGDECIQECGNGLEPKELIPLANMKEIYDSGKKINDKEKHFAVCIKTSDSSSFF